MNEKLNQSIEAARSLDDRAKIVGSYLVEKSRSNAFYAPRYLTKELVGLELPVRHPRLLSLDHVALDHDDLMASLLIQGRQEQAEWFDMNIEERREDLGYFHWGFDAAMGKIALDSATSTDTYYKYLTAKYRFS